MAGTTAPRRKRAKQTMIPGTEPERIKEIEDAAENYVSARDERMGLTEEETKRKVRLIEAMKKYDLETYNFAGYMVERNRIEEDNVKVKKARAAKED
jgi:hypothetical protein